MYNKDRAFSQLSKTQYIGGKRMKCDSVRGAENPKKKKKNQPKRAAEN